jgi:RNA polymerase sigma factor (sigma-70 family)
VSPRERLFDDMLPVARRIARGVHRSLPRSVEYGDVEAAALMGLWQSVSGGGEHENFEAYARVRIRGAIMDELRRQDWLPRRAREGDNAFSGLAVVLSDDIGKFSPAVDGGIEDAVYEGQKREALSHSLARLPDRDRRVMEGLLDGVPQNVLAAEIGVSGPRVCQIRSRALASLKKLVRSHGLRRSRTGRKNRKWSVPTPSALMARGMSRREAFAEYANSLYAARQSLGLCGNCNRPPLPGRKKCAVHATPRELYWGWKASGRCTSCGGEPRPERKLCQACLDRRADKQRRVVVDLKARGVCVSCGVRPADGGTVRCLVCKAKRKAADVRSRAACPPPSSTTTSSPSRRTVHASGIGSSGTPRSTGRT